jgi:hypothetical protein
MGRIGAVVKCAVVTVATSGIVAVPAAAWADSPPSQWTNLRTLDCDGASVEAAFAPGGVFTSFHVVDSSDVIVPKHVEVVFPDATDPVTTLHVRGFDTNARDVVTCTYVDLQRLQVTIVGIRT